MIVLAMGAGDELDELELDELELELELDELELELDDTLELLDAELELDELDDEEALLIG